MSKGLFSNAKTIKAPATEGRKPKVETVEVTGLERFAAINAAITALSALAAVEEAAIKADMTERFVELGSKTHEVPDNYKGVEGKATASMQLKIRCSASALSSEDQTILKKNNVPFSTKVKTQEAFLINPAYNGNMKLLEKVEKALSKVDLPEDFLLRQEEVSTQIVTRETLEEVFKKTPAVIEALIPVVSTLAVSAKIEGDFWSILDEIMNPVDEADSEDAEDADSE